MCGLYFYIAVKLGSLKEKWKRNWKVVKCTWFYRRLLKISWKKKVTNVEVLRRMGVKTKLLYQIKKRQLKFLGHIIRKDGIENNILTGKIMAYRARGRQRYMMRDNALRWIGNNKGINDLILQEKDRGRWRDMTSNGRIGYGT